MPDVITFVTVKKYAVAFSKRNYDEIPDNWAENVTLYIENKLLARTLRKHNPRNSNFVLFAMMLLKDPYNMGRFWELDK